MRIFETHCHLNHCQFDADRLDVTARAQSVGVTEFTIIGYDLPSSQWAVELADSKRGRYATVGIHPHDAASWSAAAERELRSLVRRDGVVAIGEIGLDFYRNLSPRDEQYVAFQAQLDLAAELGLPFIVHTRESVSASLDVIEPCARGGLRGIMHCWSGTLPEARRARELGLLLGIGGVLTYKNPRELPDVVLDVGIEGLVVETDSPYLPPVPHRGSRNEPAYLPLIIARLAELLDASCEDISEATRRNAMTLLGIESRTDMV